MEFRQLRYFMAVAEEKHFGRAAERLGMAQPPLSQQIKKLEEEMEIQLIRRSSRRVELTSEGQAFLCVVRKALSTMECGVEQVRMMARGETARLRVGFIASATHSNFPKAVARFRSMYPDITLDLREMHSMKQYHELMEGKLDAGVLQFYQSEIAGLECHSFLKEPYMLAVRKDHPLACSAATDITSLHGEDFIMYPRSHHPTTYDTIVTRFEREGVKPTIVQEAFTLQTKLALIASGMGIGLVPRRMKQTCPPEVRMVPFYWKGDPLMSELRVAWKYSEKTNALACFLKVVETFSQKLPCTGGQSDSIKPLSSTLKPVTEKARS